MYTGTQIMILFYKAKEEFQKCLKRYSRCDKHLSKKGNANTKY